jgi:hypothetical protein
MRGTGLGDQLPGAGVRAAARPNRSASASRSASAQPCHLTTATAHAATRASASPSRDPIGPAGRGHGPWGLDDGDEAAELGRGLLQHLPGSLPEAAQPALHGRGRDAQFRAVQDRRGGRPRDHPDGVCPPGADHAGSRMCVAPHERHRPRRSRSRRPSARMIRSRP